MKSALILAPHIDDELIGCFSVLHTNRHEYDKVTVLYFYELDVFRKKEALAATTKFGFDALEAEVGTNVELLASICDEVYVPSRRDWHADHKRVNANYRHLATHFYSVDMAHGKFLDNGRAEIKRDLLNELYPSQATLWETDSKYWLFEDIQKEDFVRYTTIDIADRDGQVTVEQCYGSWVANDFANFVYNKGIDIMHRHAIDYLAAHCKGKIIIKSGSTTVELP